MIEIVLVVLSIAFIYSFIFLITAMHCAEESDDQISCEIEFLSDRASVPVYKTPGAACADIYACLPAAATIAAGCVVVIPTGFRLNIPNGFEVLIRARSGLSCKNITLSNAVGTIDSDYNKEVGVILANHSNVDFVVAPGDRIAQMCIKKVTTIDFEVVEALSTVTDRGGFGSTGGNTD